MDYTDGRPASAAPSSDSSDFYNYEAPNKQTIIPAPDAQPRLEHNEDTVMTIDQDNEDADSSIEMNLSDASPSASPEPLPEPLPSEPQVEPRQDVTNHAGAKRKLTDDVANGDRQTIDDPLKKRRLSPSAPIVYHGGVSQAVNLPRELWQQIFLYLPPVALCRCLRACKTFRGHLTEAKAAPTAQKKPAKGQPRVRVLDSDAIWAHARKTHFPNLPRPLARCSELEMLQLIGGRTCQSCGKLPTPATLDPLFRAGPGPYGLRVFWPFGVRACGQCILHSIIKVSVPWINVSLTTTPYKCSQDVQILISAAATLRFGLPYCFFTPELHYIPDSQRQQPGGIPSHLRAAKIYHSSDIEAIVQEHEDAKSLGEAAAEEWNKGLSKRGKEAMADAARWEKWESQLRPGTSVSQALREYDPSSFSQQLESTHSKSTGINGMQPTALGNGKCLLKGLCCSNSIIQSCTSSSLDAEALSTHKRILFRPLSRDLGSEQSLTFIAGANTLPQSVDTWMNGYASQNQVPNPHFQPGYRPARTLQEVEEARQTRRVDIERRCLELEPPLEPNVLQHIESFQAAMQITQPMTDAAWEVLRPRILAQREAAEWIEHQRAEQVAALQAAVPINGQGEPYTKPAKEVYDKEYELAQEPLRKKLGEYADYYIKLNWSEGRHLDKNDSPLFAVGVMNVIRERYLEDKQAGLLPRLESPFKVESNRNSPVPEPFLSLDNMKWVYDNKIRPLTDPHRRELFICAACAEERKPKWFAFEGLIQHYGAKHARGAFSKGNIVVHWQTAEWPEDSPFLQDPSYFIRMDRKASEHKAHNRTRNTPQTGHHGPFAAPGNGQLLHENPYFSAQSYRAPSGSNGYYNASGSYPSYSYGQTSPQPAPYHQPHQLPAEPPVDTSFEAQINKLSSDLREFWDALDGVGELLECARIQVMLDQAVARFIDTFGQRPELDSLTDALANNSLARPIKNAHGLACKMCVANQTDGSANYQSYYARIRNVKLFNISSLITHFKLMHRQRNWRSDMIELPETQLITDLMRAPGMDDKKLELVSASFPAAFPNPLPRIGIVQEAPVPVPEIGPDSGLANRLLGRLTKKPKSHKKKGHGGTGTPARDESQEPLPEPKEDEYDPRRPMYLQNQEQAADPARFDTDARKASVAPSPLNTGAFNLAPETLAALTNLNTLTMQSQQPSVDGKTDRSPSVGSAQPASSLPNPAAGPTSPQEVPDIGAILAQLAPQQAQTATPPTTVSARSGSLPRSSHAEAYGKSHYAPPQSYQETTPSGLRYAPQPSYGVTAEPSHHNIPKEHTRKISAEPTARYDAQDFHTTASRNTAHFEHNRAQTFVEQSYAPAQHSPPRYRYVLKDGQAYSHPPPQPQQQVPVYHGEAPVQYVQLPPERERPPPTYQYERRAPQTVYVDAQGRHFIPVDSAPAPVQYAPHPFEQQQQQQRQYARQPEAVTYASAGSPPQQAQHFQPAAYDDHRRVYYEPTGQAVPLGGEYGQGQRMIYDDGARSSVPRG